MKLSSQIKPISHLKAHAAEIVRTLGDQPEPLIITQNGEAKAVLQDIDFSVPHTRYRLSTKHSASSSASTGQ